MHRMPITLTAKPHTFDNDGVCIHCGLDGAEWSHWRRNTWEGRAAEDVHQPECTVLDDAQRQRNVTIARRYGAFDTDY